VKDFGPEIESEWLLAMLGSRDATVRAGAILALAQKKGREAVPHLLRLLDDHTEVVWEAVVPLQTAWIVDNLELGIGQLSMWALGQIGDAAAVPGLVDVLASSDAPMSSRAMAARALGRIGGGAAQQALESAMAASDCEFLAESCRRAARLIDVSQSTDAELIRHLQNPDRYVVHRTIQELVDRRDHRAVAALKELRGDARAVVVSPWEVRTLGSIAGGAVEELEQLRAGHGSPRSETAPTGQTDGAPNSRHRD
jgi:HEAT repeat protein